MSKTLNERMDEIAPRIDRRRYRADVISANMMQIVSKHLGRMMPSGYAGASELIMSDIQSELSGLLRSHGAEIISDADRAAFGLPPRGPDGWTQEEIVALERRRLEVMSQPPVMVKPKGSMT